MDSHGSIGKGDHHKIINIILMEKSSHTREGNPVVGHHDIVMPGSVGDVGMVEKNEIVNVN